MPSRTTREPGKAEPIVRGSDDFVVGRRLDDFPERLDAFVHQILRPAAQIEFPDRA